MRGKGDEDVDSEEWRFRVAEGGIYLCVAQVPERGEYHCYTLVRTLVDQHYTRFAFELITSAYHQALSRIVVSILTEQPVDHIQREAILLVDTGTTRTKRRPPKTDTLHCRVTTPSARQSVDHIFHYHLFEHTST
jgi:hypothetical protein